MPDDTITIAPARSDDDIAAVTGLAWAFVDLIRERYPERADQIDRYLIEQRFAEMLGQFRTHFNPPAGECMLARRASRPVGIVMLKPAGDGVCEMNRMYVAPAARGQGAGRKLCVALIAEARALGYREMRLGALDRHIEALPLYRSLGFEDHPDAPGYESGDQGVIRLRLNLGRVAPGRSSAADGDPPQPLSGSGGRVRR